MRERGFIPLSILGSPTVWLALGCALLAFTSWAMYGRWQAAVEREAKIKGEYAAFIDAVKQRTLEIEAENDKRDKQWKAALADQRAAATRDRAALRADLERVRGRPVDPGGREIPVTSCPGTGPNDVSAKLVPLTQYESLQERAANDALQVTRLQDYITTILSR